MPSNDGAVARAPGPAPAAKVPTGASQPPAKQAAKPPPPLALPPGASDAVRLIAGLTGQKDYAARIAAVHSLGKALSRVDVEGLYAFLMSRLDDHPGLDALSLGALKNDALQALIRQDALPPDLLPAMAGMWRDASMDATWRDYCIQHVAMYYERRWGPQDASRLDDPERKEAMALYDEALASRGDGFAGTAMIGMARLSERYPEIDKERLSKEALAAVQGGRGDDAATRVTAMGVCGLLKRTDALPTARILAQAGEDTTLRVAAIGTIGLIGTAEDLDLVQSLAAGSDEAVRKAAKVAEKRIQGRTQKAER